MTDEEYSNLWSEAYTAGWVASFQNNHTGAKKRIAELEQVHDLELEENIRLVEVIEDLEDKLKHNAEGWQNAVAEKDKYKDRVKELEAKVQELQPKELSLEAWRQYWFIKPLSDSTFIDEMAELKDENDHQAQEVERLREENKWLKAELKSRGVTVLDSALQSPSSAKDTPVQVVSVIKRTVEDGYMVRRGEPFHYTLVAYCHNLHEAKEIAELLKSQNK